MVTTEMWLPPAARHAAMSPGHWLSPRLYCWIDSKPKASPPRPSSTSLAWIFALILTASVWLRPENRKPSAILAARSPVEIASAALEGLRKLLPAAELEVSELDTDRGVARVLAAVPDEGAASRRGETFPLEEANEALIRLKRSEIRGAAVLTVG